MDEVLREDEDEAAAEEAIASLRAALAVPLSPDFADRVRRQVAQRRRTQRRPGWLVLAAAAAVLVAAGALTWRLLQSTPPARPRVASEASTPPRPSPPVTRAEEPMAGPPRPAPRPAAQRAERRAAVAATRQPVRALVPRGEAERLARYVAQNRRHPRRAESLPDADPGAPLDEPAAIVIAALDVAPVVSPEGSLR